MLSVGAFVLAQLFRIIPFSHPGRAEQLTKKIREGQRGQFMKRWGTVLEAKRGVCCTSGKVVRR